METSWEANTAQPIGQSWRLHRKGRCLISLYCSSRNVQTSRNISVSFSSINGEKTHQNFLRDEKVAPDSEPPSLKDVDFLYNFLDLRSKLVISTGAGISMECGIPDYKSPNGAYSSGDRPIAHQCFCDPRTHTGKQPLEHKFALVTSRRAMNVSILSLFFYGFSTSISSAVFAEDFELERYTDSKEGFTLLRPSSWVKVDKAGATVLFEEGNKGSNNVGVVVNPVRLTSLGEFGTPQFVADKLIQAEKRKESTKDAAVVGVAERSGEGGLQVYEFEYTVDSTRGGMKRIFSAAFVASKKLYILNISHSDKPESPLDSQKRMMLEQVLHSFDAAPSS
ncbi:psbP domain-containing protein 2, chloroplastic isoform X2 [Cucumis sativus]|uniref:psbP domain-containing protein 2, chloroplastic isoform X2 n=1 Tax=Cucumis sativus TaxID=3659 RepID=UPI0005ED20D2|nr:psbP domain-containing protein 2, chloroplastic isoform X2 [Cucumis sativus]XP_031736654.1 psbP domain-containing protein 2, chloroplastic isoform X2 [Cucumis sativus]